MEEINTENLTAYLLLLLEKITVKGKLQKYLSTVLFFFPKPSSVIQTYHTDIFTFSAYSPKDVN